MKLEDVKVHILAYVIVGLLRKITHNGFGLNLHLLMLIYYKGISLKDDIIRPSVKVIESSLCFLYSFENPRYKLKAIIPACQRVNTNLPTIQIASARKENVVHSQF